MKRRSLILITIVALLVSFGIIGIVLFKKQASSQKDTTKEDQLPQQSQSKTDEQNEEQEQLEYSFGGRSLFPENRLVALYGNPNFPTLGALGEQGIDASVERVIKLTEQYQAYSSEKVTPCFEIIATIASAQATENDDYSQELDANTIKPWIETATKNGIYVVLDLQSGRSTFDDQIKQYEELLLYPNVGVALDPEWRLLTPEARHLKKIGSVSAAEINRTSEWLSAFTTKHGLPEKLFMIHQFKLSMITERDTLIADRAGLAMMIHMDGHGALSSKINSWNVVKETLPTGIYLGWKNFIDEDKPTPTPEQTMIQEPKPWFVSYQ